MKGGLGRRREFGEGGENEDVGVIENASVRDHLGGDRSNEEAEAGGVGGGVVVVFVGGGGDGDGGYGDGDVAGDGEAERLEFDHVTRIVGDCYRLNVGCGTGEVVEY